MDFVFQGFQSGLPPWLYFVLLIAALALAWWSYKDLSSLKPLFRYLLIGLRGLVFLILFALLLNPLFRSENVYYEKPEVLVVMDNSASTSIKKGDYEGTQTYENILSALNFDEIDDLSFRYFAFDSDIAPSHPDSLTYSGSGTNLYRAVEVIRNNREDANAALLFTDGIFNKGRNPVFLARELNIPIFTVALGDTSRSKDLIVRDITTNGTGYLNTVHQIETTIINQGFGGQSFQVQLRAGSEILQSQTISPDQQASSHSVNFQIELEEEGLQQFDIHIPSMEGEWSDSNNTQSFSIEVLDDRQRILSLAFEIHPDVKLVRSLLMTDENTRLSTRTWLGGTKFIESDLKINPDTLDLVILHGYPSDGLTPAIAEEVKKILERAPSILFQTPQGDLSNFSEADLNLPLTSSPGSFVDITPSPALEETEHPVMELPEISFNRLPSLYAPIRDVQVAPGVTILFTSSYRGTETGEPLIAAQQTGNRRRVQVNGYGWYRIAQSPNPQAREFVEQLIFNMASWTATKPDNRRLKIQPTQKVFTRSESVEFTAYLTNESGEVESEGVITVTITGEDINSRLYNMANIGGGQYELDIGSLSEGIYQFEATAKKGTRTIDTQKGKFSVSGSNIEYVNTTRNGNLLRRIAESTQGRYYSFGQAASIWKDMDDMNLFEQNEQVETNLFYPYRHLFWFIIVIVLLGIEWFLRKYVALP